MSMFDGIAQGYAVGTIRGLNRQLSQADADIEYANAEIRKANAVIRSLRERVEELELDLKVEHAAKEASSSQAKALLNQHPESPLRSPSGFVNKAGKSRSKLEVIWYHTFDRILREKGITNPERHRVD